MKVHLDLTYADVRQLFDYSIITGKLYWKVATSRRIKAGQEAGNLHQGYIRIKINGKPYYAHRIIWLWVTGDWPYQEIDHINQTLFDGRLCNGFHNLRDVTHGENKQNRGMQRNNTSGIKGVCYNITHSKWVAELKINEVHHTKMFSHKQDAIAHRAFLENKYHPYRPI